MFMHAYASLCMSYVHHFPSNENMVLNHKCLCMLMHSYSCLMWSVEVKIHGKHRKQSRREKKGHDDGFNRLIVYSFID